MPVCDARSHGGPPGARLVPPATRSKSVGRVLHSTAKSDGQRERRPTFSAGWPSSTTQQRCLKEVVARTLAVCNHAPRSKVIEVLDLRIDIDITAC